MPSYVNVTFNHFAAVQQWAQTQGADALLDMKDHILHVRLRGRVCKMYPMFQSAGNGIYFHTPQLTEDVRGFGGWRPYETFTHPHTRDKVLFKQFLRESGLRCPAMYDASGTPPPEDYVLKAKSGSFGQGLFGPYRAATRPASAPALAASSGGAFAEQFISGKMLKVWYWGPRAFFAHVQDYPVIAGDGRSTAETLVRGELAAARLDWNSHPELSLIFDCLAYQGVGRETVLAAGQQAWIDYRYFRLYSRDAGGATRTSDNQLPSLLQASGEQVQAMGAALYGLLSRTLRKPVAITVDGILDAQGRIWWLEMNTNSLLPPEAYAVMFADIFPQ